ncbi:GNAT family N-acetyltransferase [Micromonospora polyrhachis]|uniref:GNAT superfamily N-acetyltransferase n=1 Tax=Micromonospora polyrhachis TaxID=1282883 RepID=A0A7W7SNH4_9ACTN|nr:GNAT family N-acetyltransferase [Micromonospora polyrhachis]MBB4958042.1 GNAT superfamily N-acetyltransferase [Micromonospora polyrhachis]
MSITLRPAQAGDLMSVGELHYRSRLSAYRDIVPANALTAISADSMGRWWVERWPYERDTHTMTLAERDGRLVGFTYLGPNPELPTIGELCAIHLDPAEQGRGVGRVLMVDALEQMRQRGWHRATLWVLADNKHARRFYERGGWIVDGAERQGDVGPALTRQLRYVRDLPQP